MMKFIGESDRETVYSRKEACEILGISENTLMRWRKQGRKVPAHIKVSRKHLYLGRDLRQFVESLRVESQVGGGA